MFDPESIKHKTDEFRNKYPKQTEQLEEQYNKQSYEKIQPQITIEKLAEVCNGDELLEKLLSDVIASFFSYTETVCEYEIILRKNLAEGNESEDLNNWEDIRSRTHNALINNVNILLRNFKQKGIDIGELNLNPENRVAYAALAMQNTFRELLKYKEHPHGDE
jgi:hypothetical protein